MAEGQGFEPWVPLDTPVFKTGAFNRSAIPPVSVLCGFVSRKLRSSHPGSPGKVRQIIQRIPFLTRPNPLVFDFVLKLSCFHLVIWLTDHRLLPDEGSCLVQEHAWLQLLREGH